MDGARVHPIATLRQAQVIKGGWGETRGELGVLNLKGLLDFPVGLLGRQLDEWIWGSDERSGGPWRLWPQSK